MGDDGDRKMIVDDDECSVWSSFDGRIVKRQIISRGTWDGHGSPPTEAAVCTLNISVVSPTDPVYRQCLGPSRYLAATNENRLRIVVGDADTLIDRLIERCVRKMWVGEESIVELVVPCGCLTVRLELAGCEPPATPVYKWCPSDRLEKAAEHKARGSDLFRMGTDRIEDALASFNSAARLLFFAANPNGEPSAPYDTCNEAECDVENRRKRLLAAVCNNMALCRLKQQRPELALELCAKVLAYEPTNVKCLMRRSQALGMLNLPTEAAQVLADVLRLEPNNGEAREMLTTMRVDVARQKVDDVCLAKRMLSLPSM